MEDYKSKYIKYKEKYLRLKQKIEQTGGQPPARQSRWGPPPPQPFGLPAPPPPFPFAYGQPAFGQPAPPPPARAPAVPPAVPAAAAARAPAVPPAPPGFHIQHPEYISRDPPSYTVDRTRIPQIEAEIRRGLKSHETLVVREKPGMILFIIKLPDGTERSHSTIHLAQTPGGTTVLAPSRGHAGAVHGTSDVQGKRVPIQIEDQGRSVYGLHRLASDPTNYITHSTARGIGQSGILQPYQPNPPRP